MPDMLRKKKVFFVIRLLSNFLFCFFLKFNKKFNLFCRAKQVSDGVHHAAKLFPNAYLVRRGNIF